MFKGEKSGQCYSEFINSALRKRFLKRFLSLTGFTLIELLLVVTILGILAALMVPKFFSQSERGRVAEAIGILTAIRQGEASYFLEKQVYLRCNSDDDQCWNNLGMDNPNATAKYFEFDTINVTAAGFQARGTRNGIEATDTYEGTFILLNQAGSYGGSTHPFAPS